MQVKAFEIRDRGTFIPALGVLMKADNDVERFLLGRAGYPTHTWENHVILCRMEAKGERRDASYDEYSWGPARTMCAAHRYIKEHWDDLPSGAVICVEHILGERETPKVSERFNHAESTD